MTRPAIVVALAVALAFAVRVAPAYRAVFASDGINFQDNDSWSHMRAVENLSAHFPKRSSFDPYGVYPGGEALQNDPWDFFIASVAWLAGAGKPSSALVEEAGAWLPAILGALLPFVVFLLARRLFGELAGMLAAVGVAVVPGTLLWETHLGVPDHHVAECLLSLAALTLLCGAVESAGRRRIGLAALAGVALGAYLCVRPAGIFVPATFAIAALLAPALAPLVAGALVIASALFLTSTGSPWSLYTWLTLGAALAASVFCMAFDRLARRFQWRRASAIPLAAIGFLAVLSVAALAKPVLFSALAATVHRYLPHGGGSESKNTVSELSPLWTYPPGGFASMNQNLGGLWLIGLPFLAGCIPMALRKRRPALTLFTVWAVVMTAGGFLQLRMLIYFGPVMALGAGAGAAWLCAEARTRLRVPGLPATVTAAFVLFALGTGLPGAIRQTDTNNGPDSDWRAALNWLARNTPEPMGTPDAWWRQQTAPGQGGFRYPASAYGVLTWWEFGDQVNAIAHRMPNTNGRQAQAGLVADFLAETDPDQARSELAALGTRYVVLNPEVLGRDWAAIMVWAHGDDARYRKRIYALGAARQGVPVFVYLPDFCRSMAARLYLFDGKAAPAPPEISVFTTRKERADSGIDYDLVIARQTFSSQQEADRYMAANTGEAMVLGSTDPARGCAETEAIPWIRRVYTSDEMPLRPNRPAHAVKVFEVAR